MSGMVDHGDSKPLSRWARWREARRQKRWDDAMAALRIPADVEARMKKAGITEPPHWYAGRQRP